MLKTYLNEEYEYMVDAMTQAALQIICENIEDQLINYTFQKEELKIKQEHFYYIYFSFIDVNQKLYTSTIVLTESLSNLVISINKEQKLLKILEIPNYQFNNPKYLAKTILNKIDSFIKNLK